MKLCGINFTIYEYVGKYYNTFPTTAGIYMLCTVFNSKRTIHYIGSTKSLKYRIMGNKQIISIKKNMNPNETLVILFHEQKHLIRQTERWFLSKYNPPMNINTGVIRPKKSSLMRYIITQCFAEPYRSGIKLTRN